MGSVRFDSGVPRSIITAGPNTNIRYPVLKNRTSRKVVKTTNAPNPVGPYSQAIICNNMLFISGQIPIDPDNGASGVSPNSIQITFSKSIPPQNVTVDSDVKCTKNVQVSENNFYSCFPMSSIEDNSSSISFSLTPLTNNSKFPSNTEFKIKVSIHF